MKNNIYSVRIKMDWIVNHNDEYSKGYSFDKP